MTEVTVLVLYYSRGGRTAALARQAARGVESAGAAALLRTVPPVTAATAANLPAVPADGPPYAELDDLKNADALLLGSPTRFGNMAAPLKHFLDSTSELWLAGHLADKPAGVFTSSSSAHGGQESTLLSMQLPLLHHGMRILTHGNPGALATGGIGTALAPIYVAHARGVVLRVYAGETRPLLQGARLTSWELTQAGVPVTLLADGAAASLMASGHVDMVLVGADRIAANGDVANKIGTLALAVLAHHHRIPFVVAAPRSTIDPRTETGVDIPIEQRAPDEVLAIGGVRVGAEGVAVHNPSFDVTPAALVTHYITDRGIEHAPFRLDVSCVKIPPPA